MFFPKFMLFVYLIVVKIIKTIELKNKILKKTTLRKMFLRAEEIMCLLFIGLKFCLKDLSKFLLIFLFVD